MIDAAHYGEALFEVARQDNNEDEVSKQLQLACRLLSENPGYVTLLDTPAVSAAEKQALYSRAFVGFAPMLLNFLGLLCKERSVWLLPACAKAFDQSYDEAHGILRADVTTAVPLLPRQAEALTKRLSDLTGKQVVLSACVDPALLGGVTLRYGGVQLSDSIRSKLDALNRRLSETIV